MSRDEKKDKAAVGTKPPSDQPTRPESSKDAGLADADVRPWDDPVAELDAPIAGIEHKEAPAPKPAKKAAPPPKATRPGHTVCRITGTAVKYHGRIIPEGTEGEFEDSLVVEMPDVFVSLE